MTDQTSEPKIHIDSDWKAQAQAEKQRLAEEEAKRAAEQGPDAAQQGQLPEANFKALMSVLASQAIMSLGGYRDPKTNAAIVDLEGGKFSIDLLGVLEEKTKGNLEPEDESDLKQLLAQLRSQFVQLTQAIAEQAAKGGPDSPDAASPSGLHMPGS